MTMRSRSITPRLHAAASIRESHLADESILQIEGALHAALGGQLRHTVRALLHRGERRVVVCMARVATVDAAGVGELVRVHNMVMAANARLRIINTTHNVRTLLERLGLFDLLSTEAEPGGRERAG